MAIQSNERLGGTTYTDTGRELASQAQGKASELVGKYSDQAKSGIEDRKLRAASELNTIASALRQCGTDMNGGEEGMLAPYVERVADQVSLLSGFLERRSVDEVARDVETFARRNPAVFLGACFGVGILVARFLKSSKPPLPAGYVGYGEARYTETLSDTGTSSASEPTYRESSSTGRNSEMR